MAKYIDQRLMKLSKSNGKFIKLDVGDSFKGKFMTWRAEMDEKFQKMKPVFIFKNENGEEKQLGTGAKKFGAKMAAIVPGSIVQITKLGEGQKTDFSVKVIKEATMPADADEELEDEEDEEEDEVEEAPKKKKKKKKKKKVVEEDDDDDDDDEEEEDLFA